MTCYIVLYRSLSKAVVLISACNFTNCNSFVNILHFSWWHNKQINLTYCLHRYGKALLGLSREESGVLGDGVPGTGNADAEEEDDNEGIPSFRDLRAAACEQPL